MANIVRGKYTFEFKPEHIVVADKANPRVNLIVHSWQLPQRVKRQDCMDKFRAKVTDLRKPRIDDIFRISKECNLTVSAKVVIL